MTSDEINDQDRYERRGVSSSKSEVHAAVAHLDKGLFPRAFCKVLPDYLSGDPDYCCVAHADGAGTKTSLAYLYWEGNRRSFCLARRCAGCFDNEYG